jgi:sarcosine oxidase subunit alpha
VTFDFEGREVPFIDGDTIASALYREGVRTFNRSLKHHRRRGLYCGTGDCPNCLLTVDGEPGMRSCVTPARDGQRVARETGWPSPERDLLAVTDHLHPVMPVGFYYKTFVRPRFAWELAEKVIRRATGVGRLRPDQPVTPKRTRHAHADVLVIGGGPAGLAAAQAAASDGARVVVAEASTCGWSLAPGPARDRVLTLADAVRALPGVELLERHAAIGVYEGPSGVLLGPEELVEVEAGRIVVATGAVEAHGVFVGNDLPGIWLGRGAVRMVATHQVPIGNRAVVAAATQEGVEHAATLRAHDVQVIVLASAALAERAPAGVQVLPDARVVEAHGGSRLASVVVDTPEGRRRIEADALVLALGWSPRDALLRMGAGLPVTGAGDVVRPGAGLKDALETGRRAGAGDPVEPLEAAMPPLGDDGAVCLCEDVGVHELEAAWDEGWTSSEILKRYTTVTMGPCQGALCSRHLTGFVASHGAVANAGGRTTARPPVRSPKLEDLIGGVHEVIEKRTALHERHLALGARVDRSGSWMRPATYGDVAAEYRAVREAVSVMDVSTLGKFLVAGRDAITLLDWVFPTRIEGLAPGRARYLLALDEAGYVMDDGLVCALEGGRAYLTSTSGGADRMEAWLRNWAERLALHVHLVNQTAQMGAVNVAGPRVRDLLARLSDDDWSRDAIPYPGWADVTVAGVACRAIAVGFVGELSFELHHPRSRSVELWDALLEAGADLGIRPHGLDALDLLRMEKGHVYLAQDTLPDDHPTKLGLGWAVAMDKEWFVGKASLQRMADLPLERRFVGLRFDGVPQRGAPLSVGGDVVGRVTSCGRSAALDAHIGLGWVRAVEGAFPTTLAAGGLTATVVPTPFYDPEGERLRA